MDVQKIRDFKAAPIERRYGHRETILYALGLGYGHDPMDAVGLRFVTEPALCCVPTYAAVLCHDDEWARPEFGVDRVRLLHAEQELRLHHPLPPAGLVRASGGVSGIEDKGATRGALLHHRRTLTDAASGQVLASLRSTVFLRGDGGQGGFGEAIEPPAPLPEAPPAHTVDIPTRPDQALLYRLSGDWNPLHADPEFARRAGFERPILHGLCTYGIAARAVLAAYCENDVARLQALFARFSRPVFPGETIRLEFFEPTPTAVRFRASVVERNLVVLDRGTAEFTP